MPAELTLKVQCECCTTSAEVEVLTFDDEESIGEYDSISVLSLSYGLPFGWKGEGYTQHPTERKYFCPEHANLPKKEQRPSIQTKAKRLAKKNKK
jgi:hypothetical protein